MEFKTQAEIQREYKCSRKCTGEWKKRPDWPGLPVKKEVLDRFLASFGSPFAPASVATPDTGELSDAERLLKARADKEGYSAEREKLKLETEQGKLMTLEDHDRALASMAVEIRTHMQGLGRTLAPKLVGKEVAADIEAIISNEVWKILEALSRGKHSKAS